MGISDRLSNIRQRLPGAVQPAEDERLLQLYWNRAELKKELTRLQDERHKLLEGCKQQEGVAARMREHLEQLEDYLGNPEVATHALIYFQLRSLWRACASRLGQFAGQLQRQQHEREHRRHLLEYDQTRRARLADCDRRLADARSAAAQLEAQLQLLEERLKAMRGFWNYLKRRRLSEQLVIERSKWDGAVTQVTDLSDDRAAIEAAAAPAFPGLSINGRRAVNTAMIAYAQQLVASLSQGGLAMLAKETTARRAFDVRYGGRDDCARLMTLLREAVAMVREADDDLGGLKERTAAVRATVSYRNDADTVPLADTVGTLAVPAALTAGLDAVSRAGINVLVDDYWNLGRALLP